MTAARKRLVDVFARWKYGLAWDLASPSERRWAVAHGERIVGDLVRDHADDLRAVLGEGRGAA